MFDILDGSFFSEEELLEKEKALRWSTTQDVHPSIDLPRFFSGEFGRRFTAHKLLADKYGRDPMSTETQAFYHRLDLKKVMFETEDFYTRWSLITPEKMEEGQKYPLVIFAHGAFGPLEGGEFCGYAEFQAQEGFMAAYPQNTNPDFILHMIEKIAAHYPLDAERVYMAGYSAGGAKTVETSVTMPERLAACAPCACGFTHWSEDITQPAPDKPYVPMIRIDSEFDPSRFIPLNRWVKRVTMLDYLGIPRPPMGPRPAGMDPERDPTFGMIPDGKGGMVSSKIRPGPVIPPPEGLAYDQWKVAQFNYRLDALRCDKLDFARCMEFAEHPEDRIHHLFGVYAPTETVHEYMGVKHFELDYTNREGINALRFIAIENAPHNPTPMLPWLTWQYFKKFRRDSQTGCIIEAKD